MAGKPTKSVLLIQVRSPGNAMLSHEQECLQRRLTKAGVTVHSKNVLETPAELSWLDGIDALFIGGSGSHSVHDMCSLGFTKPLHQILDYALDHKLPGFGLCFGHQLLGQHMGAEVETRAQYSEIGTMSYELTEEGLADPIFGALPRHFHAQTGHTDAVTSIPGGITPMAQNNQLKSQAFKVDGCPFYSTQFHPDLIGSEAHSRYLALQEDLHDICPQASRENVERYVVDKDDIEGLLAHFIETTVNGEASF